MFKLEKVCDKIYYIQFDNQIDMCMHFMRITEYIESKNPMFQNQNFELVDLIDWYSNNIGNGSFSYITDWAGFNIPSKDFERAYENNDVKEFNRCDHLIYGIFRYLRCKEETGEFYLIATVKDDLDTFEHEFAHALYEMNDEYKREMDKNIDELPKKIFNGLKASLLKMSYTEHVHFTEIQAYMSTGLNDEFSETCEKYRKPFIKTFKKFKKTYSLNLK